MSEKAKIFAVFNTNTRVTVDLTYGGVDVWNKHHAKIGVPEKHYGVVVGLLTLPMWELMNVFGPNLHHGSEANLFQNNNEIKVAI